MWEQGNMNRSDFMAKKGCLDFSYLMVAGINLLILFLMPVILRIYHLSPSTGELTPADYYHDGGCSA